MALHPPRFARAPAPQEPARLIVLAGQDDSRPDALAARFGVHHRCLIPLAGRPLIAHVLQTAAQHPAIASLAVCVERSAFDPIWDVLTCLPGRGAATLIDTREDVAESVRAAAKGWEGPLLVTTADNALLSPELITDTLAALEGGDITLALASRAAVEAVQPGAVRHCLPLRDGPLAPCDLYAVAHGRFLKAAAVFGGRPASGRVSWRVMRAMGPLGLLLLWLRLETLPRALARTSQHLHARVRAVVSEDGTQAIDVGDDQSYAIARRTLENRVREADATSGEDERAAPRTGTCHHTSC